MMNRTTSLYFSSSFLETDKLTFSVDSGGLLGNQIHLGDEHLTILGDEHLITLTQLLYCRHKPKKIKLLTALVT